MGGIGRVTRRGLVGALALPALQGCAPLLLPGSGESMEARAVLQASAAAHGAGALLAIGDVSVRYEGAWRALVGRLQPALVDEGFRGGSEERLLLRTGLVGQAHTGPAGHKQVVRRWGAGINAGSVRVWFNGEEAPDRDRRDAAALVADGYVLFLLGPMLLAGAWRGRIAALNLGEPTRIVVGEVAHDCAVLQVALAPGLGFAPGDRLELFIDAREHLMRRIRFSLDGLQSTQGAVAEVDTWGHVTRFGVQWPTRFHERLLRPLPLGVHDWRLTGLDVNRGLAVGDVDGPGFRGGAVRVADGILSMG